MSEFNPKEQVKDLFGIGAYLQAKDRIRWFRTNNPKGRIVTTILTLDIEAGYAAVHAAIDDEAGGHAENFGSCWKHVLLNKFNTSGKGGQPRKGDPEAFAGDFLEWAATSAIARALAGLGYGTDDALDWTEEIGTPVDAPSNRPSPVTQAQNPIPNESRVQSNGAQAPKAAEARTEAHRGNQSGGDLAWDQAWAEYAHIAKQCGYATRDSAIAYLCAETGGDPAKLKAIAVEKIRSVTQTLRRDVLDLPANDGSEAA